MTGNYYPDNIVAIATPQQNGPIGIIRVSGKDAGAVLKSVFRKAEGKSLDEPKARYMHYGYIVDNQEQHMDQAMAVFMPITLPWMSQSGPPEFPGFTAASTWMKFS